MARGATLQDAPRSFPIALRGVTKTYRLGDEVVRVGAAEEAGVESDILQVRTAAAGDEVDFVVDDVGEVDGAVGILAEGEEAEGGMVGLGGVGELVGGELEGEHHGRVIVAAFDRDDGLPRHRDPRR